MPSNITLHYFHGRGIGEAIRLIFAAGNVSFEDRRYTIDEFRELTALKEKFPFGQMPTLEVDGRFIGQTDSIARLAARIAGLYPESPLVAAESDMIVVQQAEIQKAIARLSFDGVPGAPGTQMYPEQERKLRIAEWFESDLPGLLQRLEQLIKGPFYSGGDMSWADIAVFARLTQILDTDASTLAGRYPKLIAVEQAVRERPEIARWINDHQEDYPRFQTVS